ncbi:SEA domain protein [Necator americanus]|uniref:SEA domain protein n=1 Tax=Necator americanus TaxID=51031 RepID=W2TWZ6_NECAM|nr:SEA domain protein [Necator americanus]ETN85547.1 SEA domain protein [Necator americanus]
MLAPEPSEPHLEPTPEAMPAPEPKHHPEQTEPDNMPQNLKKAFFTMRIVSLEYMEDFADKSSGKYKKLCDQVIPQISVILKTIMGDNFVKFDVDSLMKGSVIVNGVIFTIDDIADAEDLATKTNVNVEKTHDIAGIPSRAYIERVHSSYPQSSSPSPLLIGSIIAVGVLVILIVAFIVIAINNRRTNGTMKLKDDDLPRMETGKGSYSSPQTVSVNLMSYGNGTTTTPPNQGAMKVGCISISSLSLRGEIPSTIDSFCGRFFFKRDSHLLRNAGNEVSHFR